MPTKTIKCTQWVCFHHLYRVRNVCSSSQSFRSKWVHLDHFTSEPLVWHSVQCLNILRKCTRIYHTMCGICFLWAEALLKCNFKLNHVYIIWLIASFNYDSCKMTNSRGLKWRRAFFSLFLYLELSQWNNAESSCKLK